MTKPAFNTLQIVDKDVDTWFVNTAAFRMNDPTTGHNFEPGVKYRLAETDWMKGQPTIEATDMNEDVTEKILIPEQPKGPRVDKGAAPA